jgi:hypothetical protein
MKKVCIALAFCGFLIGQTQAQLSFKVNFPNSLEKGILDGRLLLFVANNDQKEPRFQVSDDAHSQMVFGQDLENWKTGPQTINASAFGYPLRSLQDLPSGEYFVQVLLHKYETFKRADGHVVKLPMDRGEGQQYNQAPGNLISKPLKIKVEKGKAQLVNLNFEKALPPLPEPVDTKYIKHIKIRSERLSRFWGRDMFLGAHVLIPHGFDEHPEAKYPLCIYHGHFPSDFGGFSENPPAADLKTDDYSDRFGIYGYNKIQAQEAYDFYKEWTSPNFPRMLIVEIQHANPFYDDSYAVNSANIGPYGDAIMYELLPEIEKKFRGIGQGWARFMYGGSTGGWEALAAQIFYPDEFNGCFAACPDPIAFDAYTAIDLYKFKNAYFYESPWKKSPIPGKRDYLGTVKCSVQDMNYHELALGTRSRSGGQWDIWEAVYSPVGKDGYPERIFDKLTGEINPKVAAHWRENYDLLHIVKRDWAKIGPKLQGKIHLYCGDMDNYYLNNAVYLMEGFLKNTTNPAYDGEVKYGDRAEHCWNGDPYLPNYLTRLRYNTMYIPKILKRIELGAPKGADLKSWRY